MSGQSVQISNKILTEKQTLRVCFIASYMIMISGPTEGATEFL